MVIHLVSKKGVKRTHLPFRSRICPYDLTACFVIDGLFVRINLFFPLKNGISPKPNGDSVLDYIFIVQKSNKQTSKIFYTNPDSPKLIFFKELICIDGLFLMKTHS